jgi:hypothetical protein
MDYPIMSEARNGDCQESNPRRMEIRDLPKPSMIPLHHSPRGIGVIVKSPQSQEREEEVFTSSYTYYTGAFRPFLRSKRPKKL